MKVFKSEGTPSQIYPNLRAAGSSLVTYGSVLKVIGIILMLLAPVAIMYAFSSESTALLIAGPISLVAGLQFHVFGVFIAAAGEAGHALADIAMNTKAAVPTQASNVSVGVPAATTTSAPAPVASASAAPAGTGNPGTTSPPPESRCWYCGAPSEGATYQGNAICSACQQKV